MSRKKLRRGGLAAALMVALGSTAYADSVTVVTSGGSYQEAMREATYIPVAEMTGIEIREDAAKSFADVRLQVQSGKPSWDIIEYAMQYCKADEAETLFEDLDYAAIPNAQDIPEASRGKKWIAGSTVYSMVLGWNKSKYNDNPPATWADFFDVEKFPGTRALYAQPRFMLEVALLGDGVPADKIYPLDVERAMKKVSDFGDNVTVFYETHGASVQLLKNGEVDMIAILNGRVDAVIKDGGDADYTFNQGITDSGCLAVLKGSANAASAMKVINGLIDKDVQANIPQKFAYAPINPKAFDTGKIPEEKAKFLPSYPPNAERMMTLDAAWWAKNEAAVTEQWRAIVQK